MFRFASILASKISFVKSSIQPVGSKRSWSRNYISTTFDVNFKRYMEGLEYFRLFAKGLTIEVTEALDAGANFTDLKQGIRMAADEVVRNLNSRARRISTFEEIVQVGTTAANGESEIGELIANAIEKAGENLYVIPEVVSLKDFKALHYELEIVPGMKLDWGRINKYGSDWEILENPLVLISEKKISNINVIKQAIFACTKEEEFDRPLFVVAEDIECSLDEIDMVFTTAEFGEEKRAITEDIALLTGGRVLTKGKDMNSTCFVPFILGSCKQVRVLTATVEQRYEQLVILGGSGDWKDIRERCEQLRSTIQPSNSNYDQLKHRIEKLSGGVAVLKVYGLCGAELRERYDIIISVLNAAKAAKEEGIVPGGGVALLHALKDLDKLQTTNSDQMIGVQLVQNAIKMPFYTMIGVDRSIVDNLLQQNNSDLGYDPITGKYVDMVECGIIDPVKFVISDFNEVTSVKFIEDYDLDDFKKRREVLRQYNQSEVEEGYKRSLLRCICNPI